MSEPVIVDRVLYGMDATVAAWVHERLPVKHAPAFRNFTALGIVRDDRIVGGFVFANWRGHDVEVSGAVCDGFRCDRAALSRVLSYPFGQLGCIRLSVTTGRRNKRARVFVERLGFKVEGVKRRGLDGAADSIFYGLLKEDCRYLKGYTNG